MSPEISSGIPTDGQPEPEKKDLEDDRISLREYFQPLGEHRRPSLRRKEGEEQKRIKIKSKEYPRDKGDLL